MSERKKTRVHCPFEKYLLTLNFASPAFYNLPLRFFLFCFDDEMMNKIVRHVSCNFEHLGLFW